MTQNSINNTASILNIDNTQIDGNTISTTTGNTNIGLEANGTGSVSITSSAVVPSGDRAKHLGGTSTNWDNVYADGLTFDDGSNILATYTDTTSWTPTVVGTGTAGTASYSTQSGHYIRIGDLVYLAFKVVWGSHTGTGNLTVEGIPFTSTSTSNIGMCGDLRYLSGTFPANPLWGQLVIEASSDAILLEMTDTAGNAVSVAMDAGATIEGSIWYIV